MTQYQFTTDGGIGNLADPTPFDYATVQDVQIEAVVFMGEMLRDHPLRFWEHDAASLTVSDANGLVLFRLDLVATRAATMGGSTAI